jgi:hypothetical protein
MILKKPLPTCRKEGTAGGGPTRSAAADHVCRRSAVRLDEPATAVLGTLNHSDVEAVLDRIQATITATILVLWATSADPSLSRLFDTHSSGRTGSPSVADEAFEIIEQRWVRSVNGRGPPPSRRTCPGATGSDEVCPAGAGDPGKFSQEDVTRRRALWPRTPRRSAALPKGSTQYRSSRETHSRRLARLAMRRAACACRRE